MNPKSKLILLASAALCVPAIAFAAINVGDKAGVTDAEIRGSLEAAGYKIDEIEREDDEIEVTATLNGRTVEIEIAPKTGEIQEIELEDDNDEEDDD